jgi:hypothetical protein
MLLVRRLKKKPSVAPKKKRVASLLLRNLLTLRPLLRLARLLKLFVRPLRLPPRRLLQPTLANAKNLVVRTNHVPTITIVVAVAMVSAKTLHIVLRSKRRRQRHALLHVLPTKKATASVAVVAARPS